MDDSTILSISGLRLLSIAGNVIVDNVEIRPYSLAWNDLADANRCICVGDFSLQGLLELEKLL